ncbi:MAG: hypothetical protein Q8P30_01980 [Candidatus Uhrbacteria bacterium]|nr:hypothetical protein [Candidatus Uhrbacteria bacterium]
MFYELSLALLFILSILFQVSFIDALYEPLNAIPAHFIIGVLVMHRGDALHGIAWFIISGFALKIFGFDSALTISYIAVAFIGALLATRMFANRSVYALEGLGILMLLVFILVNAIPELLNYSITADYFYSYNHALISVIVGLYLGFLVARNLEHLIENLFLIKKR